MASLYQEGWRQGTVFMAGLPLDTIVLSESSRPARRQGEHSLWVVATQDCDLDQTMSTDPEPTIELRPVFAENPPQDWGIRSARLLLTEHEYVRSQSPRPFVSAAVLTALMANGMTIRQLEPARRQAFTTWLGKRYDRPAVPPEILPLVRKVAGLVTARRNRGVGARVRDVLLQCDESTDPMRFSLFAVLDHSADEQSVREWLSEIALGVPPALGVADQIEAATAAGISLQLIETSYAADVTQVTWQPGNPVPEGAT